MIEANTNPKRHLALFALLLLVGVGAGALALWLSGRSPEAPALAPAPAPAPADDAALPALVARDVADSGTSSAVAESATPTELAAQNEAAKASAGETEPAPKSPVILSGVVRTSEGAAVRATVRTPTVSATCDAEGRYELVLRMRGKLLLHVQEPGFVREDVTVEPLERGARRTLDFVLRAAYQAQGRVTDEHGSPIEDAIVTQGFGTNECWSDRDGRYRLDHLDPDQTITHLRVRCEGFASTSIEVRPRGTAVIERDIALRRGNEVRGVVTEESGAPIEKAALRLASLRTVSGPDGSFVFAAVPEGQHTLDVRKKGFAPHFVALEVLSSRSVEPLRVVLRPAHFVGGVVRDESGAPLARIQIEARAGKDPSSSSARSQKDGRFRLEGLPSEGVVLTFSGAGYTTQSETLLALDHEALEVVLRRSGKLAGRVIDAATGERLRDFTVAFDYAKLEAGERAAKFDAAWSFGRRFLSEDGSWSSGAEALEIGSICDLVISAPGHAPKRISRVCVTADPRPEEHTVALDRGGAIRGRIVYSDGLPAAGIFVVPAAPRAAYPSLHLYPAKQSSAVDGSFRFEGLPAGATVLELSSADGMSVQDGPFTVEIGGELERLITLPRGGSLRGRLLDRNGGPIGDALVQARSKERKGPRFDVEQRTNSRGEYLFEGVPLGALELRHLTRAEGALLVNCSIEITVKAGENFADLRAPNGPCSIRGTVRAGVELPERLVLRVGIPRSEEGKTPFRDRDVIVRNGRFEVQDLAPGIYSLNVGETISGTRWQGAQRVILTEGEPRDIEIVLIDVSKVGR
ncbi:MAG: carboxypeptidase regulatory-like domain-containing protein [Planctomycetes bacterium]|nr:carboxypeptidase regulatory-like domain-containing protein [Planctomycetota bacterium]